MRGLDFTDLAAPIRAEIVAGEATAPFGGSLSKPQPPTAVGLPDYLVRFYDWAYLWPASVWFFDHQPIINAILFGNYRRIMNTAVRLIDAASAGKTLQVAAVYGELTPTLARNIDDLHVVDAAPIQLETTRRKLSAIGKRATLQRMLAESLHYADKAFDTVLLFFLLHELPAGSRREALREAIRVAASGGRLVIAEYGEFGRSHWFHRFAPFRGILTWAEPFLGGFWKEKLTERLEEIGRGIGRRVVLEEKVDIFGGFYRVLRYRIE